jgi:hypothetical protein
MFRPQKRDLSMDRVARLLGEIVDDISAGRIARHGQGHEAPPEAWIWAINQAVSARDAGRLKLPLSGHGYLYEVIASWRPDTTALVPAADKRLFRGLHRHDEGNRRRPGLLDKAEDHHGESPGWVKLETAFRRHHCNAHQARQERYAATH